MGANRGPATLAEEECSPFEEVAFCMGAGWGPEPLENAEIIGGIRVPVLSHFEKHEEEREGMLQTEVG